MAWCRIGAPEARSLAASHRSPRLFNHAGRARFVVSVVPDGRAVSSRVHANRETSMHTRSALVLAAGILAAVPGLAGAVRADAVADFYKSKDLSFIVASGAGGGYDVYTRVFARTFNQHIPGHPNIVVRNMPGASGLRATNYLYNSAAKDGSEIGMLYNTNSLEPLLGNAAAHYDPLKMGWVGSIGKLQNICVTWHTSPVKTLADLKQHPDLTVAATGATGNSATMPRILNDVLGTNIKVIVGYSTSGQRLALERGEVQGVCGLGYSTLAASNPEWISGHEINILAQVGLHPDTRNMPNVPMVLDSVKDPKKKQVLELLLIRQEWGRPIATPPNVPGDRLSALQTAFDATMKDPKFIKDAAQAKLEVEPLTGKDIEGLLHRAYSYPKDVVQAAAKLVGAPKQDELVACGKYTHDAAWCDKPKKKSDKAGKKS
jgi:tripartite-type tricarboxylate transporter receptor subunit TctC